MSIVLDGTGSITGLTAGAGVAAAALSGQVPDANAPSGSVIHVYEVTKTDTWSKTGWGMADITGLSITLTPASASSKFLIIYNVRTSSNYYKSYINLLRNGTVLFANADGAGDNRARFTSTSSLDAAQINADGHGLHHTLSLLDSPATTSAITYKLQGSGRRTGDIMYVNRSVPDRQVAEYDDRYVSNMMVLEIAG